MKLKNPSYHLRSYHGNYTESQGNKSDTCYFNPLYSLKEYDQSSFRYLFPELARKAFDQNFCSSNKKELIALLTKLAEEMVDILDNTVDQDSLDSAIPAGYTYFGQFIDHDISAGTDRSHPFQITKEEFDPQHPNCIEQQIVNLRTPHFDLDSVYGGPGVAYHEFPHFYQKEDIFKFKVGINDPNSPGHLPQPELENNPKKPQRDLPRISVLDIDEKVAFEGMPETTALIGDLRNDENLIIAQFHLAFLKFHNQLIDDFRKHGKFETEDDLFLAARRELTLTYQWLVINDFLKQTIMESAIVSIVEQDSTIFDKLGYDEVFMPLEFATAAYRFGHSMVRNQYDFNINFGRGASPLLSRATFDLLFEFTGRGAVNSDRFNENLPQNWIIQWERFFDIAGQTDEGGTPIQDRFARKVDIKLADFITRKGMQNEDIEFLSEEERAKVEVASSRFNEIMKHLAKRNLLRGYLLNMPSAQDLIDAINDFEESAVITPLSTEQLQHGNSDSLNELLNEAGYIDQTPLWFYILREAAMQQSGNSLGQLGSWIVGQTIIGLIKRSSLSVFHSNWSPTESIIPGVRSINGIMDFLIYAGVALPRANGELEA